MPKGIYKRPPPMQRLQKFICVDISGCWKWTGYCDDDGYGRFEYGGAHIASYELHGGVIPEGFVLDHLCRNRACVNPQHLEPVTQRENIARSDNHVARKMTQVACDRGHPLEGENLYITPDGRRQCRSCRRLAEAKYREARLA